MWLDVRRKEILAHATTEMNLEGTVLSKISQIQKDKCYGSTYVGCLESQVHRDRK